MEINNIIEAIRAKKIRFTDHADEEIQADKLKYEDKLMKSFDKCPICGNDLIEKDVEKLLRGGKNTAIVNVRAEVCQHCGERLYSEEQVRLFEQIRNKLSRGETHEYQHLGKSYRVTAP